MPDIEFTQYLRPDGHRRQLLIDRPAEVYAKAQRIVAAGYRLEVEHLQHNLGVSLTIFSRAEDMDVAGELVANGPEVPEAVDRLILNFEGEL